jgi:hypothetical protein
MLDVVGEDLVTMGEDDGHFAVVGAAPRVAARRLALPSPAWSRTVSPQGVSTPKEELDVLPMVTTIMDSTTGSGRATAQPQRPFRGERIIATATLSSPNSPPQDVSFAVVIDPAIFVGAVQVGASQGAIPLSAFSALAFGVRLSFPAAGQGTQIFIPYRALVPIPQGQSVTVSMTIFGRAVR